LYIPSAEYPNAFFESKLAIISKTDLLPYVDFDMDRCVEYIGRVNPQMDVLTSSSKTEEGVDDIVNWISDSRNQRAEVPIRHIRKLGRQIEP